MHIAFCGEDRNCKQLISAFNVVRFQPTDEEGAKLSVDTSSELPNCAVCLEKMEDGVLTILCNHSFHFKCLQQWEDST